LQFLAGFYPAITPPDLSKQIYPDEQAAEAGLKGVAEWRDHHPEILESAEDNFYLEGFVTNFM